MRRFCDDGPRRGGAFVVPRLLVTLLAVAGPVVAPPAAGAQDDPRGGREGAVDEARPPEGALRPPVLRDPRLEPDSTLLPLEWPALERLRRSFVGVRPALESVDVEGSASRIPELDAAARGVLDDALPPPLAGRAAEVRGLVRALRASLARAAELAPAAAASLEERSAEAATDEGIPAEGRSADTVAAEGATADSVVADGVIADSAAAEGAIADSAAAADPLTDYLTAWRDAAAGAEALLHLVRNSGSEPDAAPTLPVSPGVPD